MKFQRYIFAIGYTVLITCTTSAMDFKAGFSAKEIKLPEGISLASYTTRRRPLWQKGTTYAKYFKPSTGKLDPIRVKATVFEFGIQKLALVSIDLVAVSPAMHEQVGPKLKDIGVGLDNLFISALHTHSGPGGFVKFPFWEQFASDKFNPEILELLNHDIEEVVRSANARLTPARIAVGTKTIMGVTMNRRGSNYIDPVATLIRVDDTNGHTLGSIINFPIHGTILDQTNFQLSSDVPGYIERHFEKISGSPSLFFQSDEGDIAPETLTNKQYDAVKKLGSIIAEEIYPLWQGLKTEAPQSFQLISQDLEIGKPAFNAFGCVSVLLPKWPISGHALVSIGEALPSHVTMSGFQIDNHAFVFTPGELIAELGLEIKSSGLKIGYKDVSIFGLTNSYIGYILNEKEYKRGGYESCVSFYGPELGTKLTNGARLVLERLRN